MSQSPTLCTIILAHNNAQTIEKCVRSAKFSDQVIVIDSGSTDDTREIAARCGAKVHTQPWLGYAQQRNKAIELTTCDWILMLDSDEHLSEHASKLLTYLKTDQFSGFSLNIKLIFREKVCHYFHNKKNGFLRLFKRSCGQYNPHKQVHEDLQINGKTTYLRDIIVYHQSFTNITDMIAKMNTYTSLNADYTLTHTDKQLSVSMAFVKFIASFVKHYLFNKGFMDGPFGFVYSIHYALSSYFHAIKCVYPDIQKEKSTVADNQ